MSEVIVFSAQYVPIGTVSIEKAICLIYLQRAQSLKDSDRVIRSVSLSFPVPIAIVIPDAKYVKRKEMVFTKRNMYKRDDYTCQYCGSKVRNDLTIDHVIPRKRWAEIQKKNNIAYGLNSFENCVTACMTCNQKKSDKLVHELGWKEQKPKKPLTAMEIDWDSIIG